MKLFWVLRRSNVGDLVFCVGFQFDGFQKEAVQMVKPAKGTTTLAFIFKEGVMVAADSRASMGGYICMLSFFTLLFSLYLCFSYS